jgi:hypothetical protein
MAGSENNWVLPVGVALVLGMGALWAVSQNGSKRAADQEDAGATEIASVPRPFEDMPPEELPEEYRASGASAAVASAPAGLAENAAWIEALALAETAETHFAAAEAAMVAGDRAQLNAEGKLARTLFDRALEDTAVWEEELLSAYGEGDPQVRAIKKQRSKWFDRTRWLHKSIAR